MSTITICAPSFAGRTYSSLRAAARALPPQRQAIVRSADGVYSRIMRTGLPAPAPEFFCCGWRGHEAADGTQEDFYAYLRRKMEEHICA